MSRPQPEKNTGETGRQNRATATRANWCIDKVGVRGLRFRIQVRDKTRHAQNTVGDHRYVRGFAEGIQRHAHEPVLWKSLNAHGSVIHVENILGYALHSLQKNCICRHVPSGNRVSVFHVQDLARVAAGELDGLYRPLRRHRHSKAEIRPRFPTVKANVTTLCPWAWRSPNKTMHNQRGEVTVAIRSRKSELDRGFDRGDRKAWRVPNFMPCSSGRMKKLPAGTCL